MESENRFGKIILRGRSSMVIKDKLETIVLTGASSFIGMHLANQLAQKYNVVATISKDPAEEIRIERIKLLKQSGVKIINLDITHAAEVVSVAREFRPSFWFNHAGWVKDYASSNYDSNYADQVHLNSLPDLFKTLKEIGTKGFIGTGSSMEYSDSENPHREDEVCSPTTAYGASKLRQTQLSLELGKKYNLNTAIIRVFIPYGELDSPSKMLPGLLRSLEKGEKFPLSPGLQVRSFIAVEKLIAIYLKIKEEISKNKVRFEIYNGAYDPELSLKQFILNQVNQRLLNTTLLDFDALPLRKTEVLFSFADTHKVRKLLEE